MTTAATAPLRPASGVPQTLARLLLTAVLVELFLGGGGRVLELPGGLTLRMLFFGLAMLYILGRANFDCRAGIPNNVVWLLLAFVAVAFLGALIGVAHNLPLEAVFTDLQRQFYFPMILFFTMTITGKGELDRLSRLLMYCGVLQAALYLVVLYAVSAQYIDLAHFYELMSERGEVFFRWSDEGFQGFFYKGFLFMCLAVIFLVHRAQRRSQALALFVLLAVALTFTRGFLVALAAVGVIALLLRTRHQAIWIAALAVGALAAFALLLPLIDPAQIYQRGDSDSLRLEGFRFVFEELNVPILLFGHGLGSSIAGRSSVETTYLEILYKQGLVGLLFWGVVFFQVVRVYRSLTGERRKIAEPYFLSVLFVYIITAANPFLNNPIGMSMILLSIAVLNLLGRSQVPGLPPLSAATAGSGRPAALPAPGEPR